MHRDPRSFLGRINRERSAVVGCLAGCLILFLFADHTLGWLLPFEYTGYDYDEKMDLQWRYTRMLEVLSGIVTVAGGFAGALCAADFQRNGWRFSVRAMLITTTLVSVALWMIVAARST